MMSSIFDEVVTMLSEVIGDDFLIDEEITSGTSFSEDLAMESIEFVELSEKLQERYGARVSLVSFIADMDIDGIMGITVGQLTGFIESRLAASA
jgi:acyl carrier protein